MAEAMGPTPWVLLAVFLPFPSHLRAGLWVLRVHVYLGWVSVSWTEWDRRAWPEALLVHVLARPEDPRPGAPTPAPGAGGGGGSPTGGAPLCPHHRPLQVGPRQAPGQGGLPASEAAPFLTPASVPLSVQGSAGRAASLPPASAASSCGMREWWTS